MPGKVKYHELTSDQKRKYLGEFYSMVALLESRQEVKSFFKDLLTLSEITMISRRIQIAKLLLEGKNYDEIRKALKAGRTNISQVEKWLNNGFGGYKNIITKYNKKNKIKDKASFKSSVPFSREWVRKKYPMHYFLSNLLNKK